MKKCGVCFLLCIALLLVSCQNGGAGQDSNSTPSGPLSSSPATDSLSVYVGDYMSDSYLDAAITLFQRAYPNVTLEVTKITIDDQTAAKKLPAELAAGRGPDLIIATGSEFTDFYKALNTGVFCDLAPIIQSFENYNESDYVQGIINAGIFNGKQYFEPLAYYYPAILTSTEALNEAGVQKSDLTTFNGIMKTAAQYGDTHPGFSAFFLQKQGLSLCIPWANASCLDYESRKVITDSDAFRTMLESYQLLYKQDWLNGRTSDYYTVGEEAASLREQHHLFTSYLYGDGYIDQICLNYEALLETQSPILMPLPSVDGKTCASIALFAAIRSNSENQANAAAFMEILLSKDIQIKFNFMIPVLKEAILNLVHGYETNELVSWQDADGTILANLENMSEEETTDVTKLLTTVDSAYVMTWAVSDIIFRDMETYLSGNASYESCIDHLQNDLTIYISE